MSERELAAWNDRMFGEYPTPYTGIVGVVERMRLRTVRSFADIKPSDTVLEIGCEAGNLMLFLPQPRMFAGFDISFRALLLAKKNLSARNRPSLLACGNAENGFPFCRGQFSVIICSEMLEHLGDPRRALEHIHALCSPSTRIVVTVPNERPKLAIKAVLRALGLMKILMPNVEPAQGRWHLQQFSKKRLLRNCTGLFEVEKVVTLLGLHVIARLRAIEA